MADSICQILATEMTLYRRWCGALKSDQVERLKGLELENSRLPKAVSDLTQDKPIANPD
jgi:putative transposase